MSILAGLIPFGRVVEKAKANDVSYHIRMLRVFACGKT